MTEDDTQDDDYGVINIGWDEIRVYLNVNGDICISQHNPLEGQENLVLIPQLYCDVFLREVKRAVENDRY